MQKQEKSFDWFNEARFGMFVHWGLYSVLGGEWKGKDIPAIAEWIMYFAQIPVEEYRSLAMGFTGKQYSAKKWVELAVKSGMKYLVITSKHHEGFALFDTEYSDYKTTVAAPIKKDVVRELSEECAKQGIRFGVYYSQAQDWDEPNGYGNSWDFAPNKDKNFVQYFQSKVKPQVKELLTQYGKIDVIWFDTPVDMTEEQSLELRDFVKSLQPECLISGRIGNGVGDYRSTGDNMIPTRPIYTPWEIPGTLNTSWGYRKADHFWKTPEQVIRKLVNINSKGGNYILNVGPDGDGGIPGETIKTLTRVGEWMEINGESIYGTSTVPLTPYNLEFGAITAKKAKDGEPGKVYIHILNWGQGYDDVDGELFMYGLKNTVAKAYALADRNNTLPVQQFPPNKSRNLHSLKVFLPDPNKPFDDIDSVICLEIEGELSIDVIEENTAI